MSELSPEEKDEFDDYVMGDLLSRGKDRWRLNVLYAAYEAGKRGYDWDDARRLMIIGNGDEMSAEVVVEGATTPWERFKSNKS